MDTVSKDTRSKMMSCVRASGNKSTEIRLIELMKSASITNWRRNSRIFGKPDIVFPKLKIAIFVDGCFWHGCRICSRSKLPQSHKEFWKSKIKKNRERDKLVSSFLRRKGYIVIRIRECQLRKNPNRQISRILKAIKD